jgi:hypothetical protein
MKKEKLFLAVRLWHPSLKAEEITGKINRIPTSIQTAGEKFKTPKGLETKHVNRETFIVYDFLVDNNNLTDAIKKANLFMCENISLYNEIRKTGGKCDYYITLNTDRKYAFVIPPDIFNECAMLDINLEVEIYTNIKI